MKLPTALCLFGLLLAACSSQAQTVLQGDSIYYGLQPHKDSLATVVAQFGMRYRKQKILSFVHGLLTGGGDMHGTRLDGYALRYKKLGATFCVDDEMNRLFRIQLSPRVAVVSARGIRPGAADFALVIEKYGPSERGKDREGQPRVSEITFDLKTYFTALRYPHITFISRGKPKPSEDLLKRKVQEIWLW